MVVSTFAFIGLSFMKPRSHRVFHYITAAITMVAAIAYFSMGSDLGMTPIEAEFKRSNPKVHGNLREIFYVRYIDWYTSHNPPPPRGGGTPRPGLGGEPNPQTRNGLPSTSW